ncbi:uncharacterized protein FMAN_06267 [Fusarium mangiferae]|uniref:Uncharacterized protein n=1 Tax=Fusarium mangiferae TaxID=192010 RepID=A0A1L7STT7_FUSMA|nr:uncharacterized protein FMAN_06267 [Fusarium mangiferae]CVK86462.1 uncharacterized protein FMAN_06267 [Fusarium mangiferae]
MKFQLVPILAYASPCLAQVAANPPDGKHYSPVPLNTLSENLTSVNVAPYQSNTSLYYLGYKDEDWSRPFVKYWKPAVKQISDEVQKGITESPHASSLGSARINLLRTASVGFLSTCQLKKAACVLSPLRLSINEKDQKGRSALHLAAFSGHLKTLSKIIECGANANEPFLSDGDSTTLHWAARESKAEIAKALLASGANVDARDYFDRTALYYACMKNSIEVVEILIAYGADVNAEERSHLTPLWLAAQSGSIECAYRLLKAETIDINARHTANDSPLYRAIERGHGDIVKMLVEKGAKISPHMVDFALELYKSGQLKVKEEVQEEDKNEEEEGQEYEDEDEDEDEDKGDKGDEGGGVHKGKKY